MSYIDVQDAPYPSSLPMQVLMDVAGEKISGFSSTMNLTVTMTVGGGVYVDLESDQQLDVDLLVPGAIDDYVDIESQHEMTVDVAAPPNISIDLYSQQNNTVDITASTHISQAERFEVRVIVDRSIPVPSGRKAFTEILTVDGQQLDVISWSFKEDKKSIRQELQIELLNVQDRLLINRNSQITFQVGVALASDMVFQYRTLLDSGFANESSWRMQPPSRGADSFTFTGLSSTQAKLNRTPARNLVLYDPTLLDVDPADFRVVYDEYGRAFKTEIVAIPGMTMYDIFNYIFKGRCGFGAVGGGLPTRKWRVSRIDFAAGESYLSAIAPRIGMYEPALEEIGASLYVRGTGVPYPSGQPTPLTIEASDSVDITVNTDHKRIDVIEMVYNLWTYEFDYFTDVARTPQLFETNNGGERVITIITTYDREYYRQSQPTQPVHIEPIYQNVVDVRGDGWVMEQSRESYYYKGTNRVRRIKYQSVPVPTITPPYTPVLNLALTEYDRIIWKTHPLIPSRQYQWWKNMSSYGLIAVDTERPRADGTPFREALVDSHRKANFQGGMSIVSGPIRSEDEVQTPLTKDFVDIRILKRDHCAETTERSFSETRVGDIGKPVFVNDPREMYIFDSENAERTFDFKETVNIGELPPVEGKKLCRQKLQKAKLFPHDIADVLDGLEINLRPGQTRNPIGRTNANTDVYGSLGVYEVTSVQMSGGKNGYFTMWEGEQSA